MACEGYPLESNGWWSMALKLFADNRTKEAFTAFERAASDTASISRFGSYVWMGHIRDMQDRRKEALKYYETALALFPGFPIQHDNWKIVIDEAWIRERLRTPFRGIQK
jgi:tetratricopeptide (TPR) repeat protein